MCRCLVLPELQELTGKWYHRKHDNINYTIINNIVIDIHEFVRSECNSEPWNHNTYNKIIMVADKYYYKYDYIFLNRIYEYEYQNGLLS